MTGQAGAGRGGICGRGNAGAGGMRGRGGGRSFPRKLMEKDLTKMSSITSPIDGHLMSLFEVNAYLNGVGTSALTVASKATWAMNAVRPRSSGQMQTAWLSERLPSVLLVAKTTGIAMT